MSSIFIPRAHRMVAEFDVIEAFQNLWNGEFTVNVEMKSRNDRNTGEPFWMITVVIDHDGEHAEINHFFNQLNHSPTRVYLSTGYYLKCIKHREQRPRTSPEQRASRMLEDDFERSKARVEALDAELNDMLAEQVNPMPPDYEHWVLRLKPYKKWKTIRAVEEAVKKWNEELRDRINKDEQQEVAVATEHRNLDLQLLLARAEWRTIPEDVQKFLIEGNWANEEEFNREFNQAMWSGVR
jgi:hypothetical protein